MIKIDGVDIPSPSDFSVGVEDIVQAERNANGTMIIEHIATKVKLEFAWKYLSKDQLQLVLNAIKPILFTVEYPDPELNAMRTLMFYKGGRKIPMLDYNDGIPRWKDIGFNVIER